MSVQKVLNYFTEHPPRVENRSAPEIAKLLDVSEDIVIEARKQFRETAYVERKDNEIKGKISLDSEPGSEEEIFEFFKVDPVKWEISRMWSIWKNGQYHVSVFFKPKELKVDIEQTVKNLLSNIQPLTFNPVEYAEERNLALVLCMFDIHFGRITHSHYSNSELDYNLLLEDLTKVTQELIGRLPHKQIEKIYLPIGNDFFNVDTSILTTTKGTPQDNTFDLHSVFDVGLYFMTQTIQMLSHIAPVEVIIVPGNHDRTTSMYMAVALDYIFQNYTNVVVDSRPVQRKYVQYGNNGLGFDHGELKMDQYARLFPYEAKKIFSETEHHEVLLGHYHHERGSKPVIKTDFILESDGVVVRHLGAMTKQDRYTYASGYQVAKRRAYAIMYHKDKGRFMEYFHTF